MPAPQRDCLPADTQAVITSCQQPLRPDVARLNAAPCFATTMVSTLDFSRIMVYTYLCETLRDTEDQDPPV